MAAASEGVLRMIIFLVTTFVFPSGSALNPGLQLRFSKNGLNYAANVAVNVLSDRVKQLTIPDQKGTAHISIGKVEYEVTNVRIREFVKPSTVVELSPVSGLVWKMINVGVSVHGDWRYRYKRGFIRIRDHGSFDGTVSGASITVSVSMGLDSASGHPTLTSTNCNSHIDSVRIRLHGGASWLYNLFIRHLERPLREKLAQEICVAARKAIDEDGREELATLKLQVPVDGRWNFDYRLVAPPEFQPDYLSLYHKGKFFLQGDTRETPFEPYQFPVQPAQQMVTFWLSDYILNSIGYSVYNNGILRYTLTKNVLSPSDQRYLDTTCTEFSCFGVVVPQVGQAFPNASVEIEMEAAGPPQAVITDQTILVRASGLITYRARFGNASLFNLFKTNVSVTVGLSVELSGSILKGDLNRFVPKISIIDSHIGTIPEKIFKTVFNLAARLFIVPKLKEVCQKGVPLPNIKNVELINPTISMESRCLRLATDLRYTPRK